LYRTAAVRAQLVGVRPGGRLIAEVTHKAKNAGLGMPGHGARVLLASADCKPSMGLAADPGSSSSSSSARLFQAVQQPRWKAEQLTAELQGEAAAARSSDGDNEQQQLQAWRMRVLGLERQPYLKIAVQLQPGEPPDSMLSEAEAAASGKVLLARQVSAQPRVWQWPGGLVPSWAVFSVQLKVALLVAELTRLISRLAAQQQQQQRGGTTGQGVDVAEQQKKEQRRLKRQMRDQQGLSAAAEVQLDNEE
jgi:hypothetical protein